MKTILVVDDDYSNLKIAKELLNVEYKVVVVDSGADALMYLSRKIPDLILLDINMPIMDGREVMRKINDNKVWSKTPVIFLTADRSINTEIECFRAGAVDYIGKPFVPEIVLTRIRRTLEVEDYRKDLEQKVNEQTKEILGMQQKVLDVQEEVMQMQQEVILSMANLIESRDGNTGEHVKRTNFYVELIVNELKKEKIYDNILTDDYIANLCKAAAMHDIGKITTPDNILRKPGKLTSDEFEIMKQHTSRGGEIIRNTMSNIENKEYIDMAYDVAVSHHEKWNGTGYPNGLSGDKIPLCARIMAVADVFDALVSERCYKQPMSVDDAFGIIEESKGIHFDEKIADVFIKLRPEVEKMLNSAEE